MYPLKFWIKNPTLLYGLSALLGTYFFLLSPLALLPFLFLLDKKHLYLTTLFFILPLVILHHFYTFPPFGTVVKGRFEIHSIRQNRSFSKGWIYTGLLKTAEGRIPCRLSSKAYYQANRAYSLTGTLVGPKMLRPLTWEPIEKSYSLAELRYEAKKGVHAYIERHIKQRRAAHFLAGMVTGQLEDRVMLSEFGNLGLSHIMAISGFHFALLTLAFHLILRLFLPHKTESILLMILLTLYLLFIGDSPSIQRAWTIAMVFLLGQLLERPPHPLNSLGVALLFTTLLNPLSSTTLSFQLSFLATGGILLGYEPLDRLLKLWIPKLPLKEVVARPLLWQHGYLIAALLRGSLALTGAVHLTLLPLLLYYFHTFSLNSLIYNLFFPFCAGIALFLFILGVLTGGVLHPLNGWYCEKLLTITESPPLFFKSFYVNNMSIVIPVVYITTLFILLIWYNQYSERPKGV